MTEHGSTTKFVHYQSSKLYPNLAEEFRTSSDFKNYRSSKMYNSSGDFQPDDLRRRQRKPSESSDDESDVSEEETQKEVVPEKEEKVKDTNFVALGIVLLIIFIITTLTIIVISSKKNSPIILDVNKAEELYDLEKHFPTQSQNLWTTIVSGIKNLYGSEPKQPCIILLLLNQDDYKSQQQETGECIAKLVAKKVVSHMSTNKHGPAIIDAKTVKATDYGETLQFFASKITSQKALVLTNLQDLSGSVAQSLHVLCDRYNPMVRDALVVFTLKSEKHEKSENVAGVVQSTLTKLWAKDVPPDKLPALVTRIAASVVTVIPENNLPMDCL